MILRDIMVKRVKEELSPDADISELEISHVACSGGKVKIGKVGATIWVAECLRCMANSCFFGSDVASIFRVAIEGREGGYGVGMVPYKILPK